MKNFKIKPLLKSYTTHLTINRKLGAPSLLDWRQRGAVTIPKDQGYCGDCWAFATAAYCQSSLIIHNGYNKEIDLSEQYLLQCTQQSDCKGGYPSYALQGVIQHGIPRQQLYPYNPFSKNEGICQSSKGIKIKGKQVFVYFMLNDIQLMLLLQNSPVIVGVGSEDWQHYKGGIMNCKPNVTEDHAVLLVGYTPKYWIVKNSWGPNWGENGYIRISKNIGSNCLMGIQADVLYSIQLYFFTTLFTSLLFLILN